MTTIENYLDNMQTNNLSYNIINTYKYFGYEYENLFKSDLLLLLEHIYTNISLVNDKKIRLEQKEFRDQLLKLYNNKCIITGNDCTDELSACHIIPVSTDGEYDVNNGLLMEHNLHTTYDKFLWSINPSTMKIEINPNKNANTIKKYTNNDIKILMNPYLYVNLKWHYDKFIEIVENKN